MSMAGNVKKSKKIEWCSVHFSDWFIDPDDPTRLQSQCSWSVACGPRPGQAKCRQKFAEVVWWQVTDRWQVKDDEGNWE